MPALPQAVEVARLTTPLPGANGSGDLLSPASASSSGRERSGTVGSSSSKHKGLRGIFRKSASLLGFLQEGIVDAPCPYFSLIRLPPCAASAAPARGWPSGQCTSASILTDRVAAEILIAAGFICTDRLLRTAPSLVSIRPDDADCVSLLAP